MDVQIHFFLSTFRVVDVLDTFSCYNIIEGHTKRVNVSLKNIDLYQILFFIRILFAKVEKLAKGRFQVMGSSR